MIRPDVVIVNWLLALPFFAAFCSELFPGIAARIHSKAEVEALAPGPFLLGALASVMGVVLALSLMPALGPGGVNINYWWTADFYHLRFAADGLAAFVILAIFGLGLLIHLHMAGLPKPSQPHHRAALLLAAQGCAVGAVLSADVVALVFLLELMLVCLWALAAMDAPKGAFRMLATAHVGGLLVLGGMLVAWQEAGDTSLAALPLLLVSADPGTTGIIAFGVLLGLLPLISGVPGHGWGPLLAKDGPAVALAPTSLLLLVGGYGLLRLLPGTLILPAVPALGGTAVVIGLCALGGGALRLWLARSLRQVAAWLTVAQAGHLLIALGVAAGINQSPACVRAASLHVLLTPLALIAVWSAASGMVTRVGTDAIAGLGGLFRQMPLVGVALLAGGMSIAGVPPLGGFRVQQQLLSGLVAEGRFVLTALLVIVDVIIALAVVGVFRRAFLGGISPPTVARPSPWLSVQLVLVIAALLACGIWGASLVQWSEGVQNTILSISP